MPVSGTDKLFARVLLAPGSFYVVRADKPIDYPLGRTFTVFEICDGAAGARVFVMEKAIEIRDTLTRLFPKAKLEPATFEQWIEQQAG